MEALTQGVNDAPAVAAGPGTEIATVPEPGAAAPGTLKGVSKAAALLVSLGAEQAASIFNHLREEEIERLSLEMAQLDSVPP